MLRSLTLLLILSLALYWYATVGILCKAPLSYQVVVPIDQSFGITEEGAKAAANVAVSAWEGAIGRDLFYEVENNADITINFVYDERQKRAIDEEKLRESLENKQLSSNELQAEYDKLVAQYKKDSTAYEARVAAYDGRLEAFNAEVVAYNGAGGVPSAVYEEVKATEIALEREATILDEEAEALNQKAVEINVIGEKGNQIIRQYNNNVEFYNQRFGHEEEFTQGDYQDGVVNIYTFASVGELEHVLAHEFGHALSLPHVEGSESIMYYLLEDQPTPLSLSEKDVEAVLTTCGETGRFETTVRALINRYLINYL